MINTISLLSFHQWPQTTLELGMSSMMYQELTSKIRYFNSSNLTCCSGKCDVKWQRVNGAHLFAIGDWTMDLMIYLQKVEASATSAVIPDPLVIAPCPPLHPWQWPMHRNVPPQWMVRQQHRHPTRGPRIMVVWPSMTRCLVVGGANYGDTYNLIYMHL